MPASLILRFARESRRFIVSSGTRNARAISSVRQPAERAQGQRDLRLETEGGMAAREDQLEPLVGERRLLHLVLHGLGHLEQARLLRERAFAAKRSIARLRAVIVSHAPGLGACPRAASARRRPRTPPARLPRRGRNRRGSRSGSRGRGPTRRGRPARAAPTSSPTAAPRPRRPSAPPESARRARAPHRDHRPRPGDSRRGAPSRRRTDRP